MWYSAGVKTKLKIAGLRGSEFFLDLMLEPEKSEALLDWSKELILNIFETRRILSEAQGFEDRFFRVVPDIDIGVQDSELIAVFEECQA